jgi:hypothetical protein
VGAESFRVGGIVNDPDLIRFLVERGFSEERLKASPYSVPYSRFGGDSTLTGNGVILVNSDQQNYSLEVNTLSADPNRAVINIRIGDASQEIIDQVVGEQGRVVIFGDSRQPFRLGPTPNNGLSFVPDIASNRLEDYNPTTNNFAFKLNASQPLIYPSNLFSPGASGLAGGIAIDDGTNASLVGSLQYRSFTPKILGGTNLPGGEGDGTLQNSGNSPVDRTTTSSGGGGNTLQNSGNSPVDRPTSQQQFQTGEAGQVAQRQLNRQDQAAVCNPSSTIASSSLSETRSPRATTASTTTANAPCTSAPSDDAQILKILGE